MTKTDVSLKHNKTDQDLLKHESRDKQADMNNVLFQQDQSPLSAIFIGAHADDIEIACGGTVSKLNHLGWQTWVCILTAEADSATAALRREEAIGGATACGVAPERVLFLGARDTQLRSDGPTVGALRKLLLQHGCNPDLVFAHTGGDSHGDHRSAHELVLSAFRKKPILCFAVVNSLVSSAFVPHVFVNVTNYTGHKALALSRHRSQSIRVDMAAISRLAQRYVPDDKSRLFEPFELILQEGAQDLEYLAMSLNDDAFHGFWFPKIRYQGIASLYSDPIHRLAPPRWSQHLEREGYAQLTQAFTRRWHGDHPLREFTASASDAKKALLESHVILSGGPASNVLTQQSMASQENSQFVFIPPKSPDEHWTIHHRLNGQVYAPTYSSDGNEVIEDYGLLTVKRNPWNAGRTLIGCMGLHGYGTKACFQVLSEPQWLAQFFDQEHFQVLLRVLPTEPSIELVAWSVDVVMKTGLSRRFATYRKIRTQAV
ncbi:PIG-L deacetylase family protein [Noviherbaspirillum galbum]|uniref:PIG-L family deacetylase n=1 Tax=Noviherbaspirillum galbum TaxID=2709383 RepID=A0A6B3SY34_9BURK|nr:PIG-L deacetylase family protein [Noviherbaspirillum galbum]NEX64575.1 hypothetical protein [Noviherbaspirillum galbum]